MRRIFAVALLLSAWPSLEGQTLNDFFDSSKLHDVYVTIAPTDWQALKDHYLENTYYRCDVQWRDIVLPNCGLRSRGSGSRSPIKPALGIDFSRNISSQRLLGLKSLVLRNLSQDTTGMRELLSEKLFARMGLPHSREAHARLFINGAYAGLYLMVEPIDKRFLLTRFGEDTGYLYEMAPWTGYRFEYRGDDPALYVPGLLEPKTREDETHQGIVDLVRAVNQTPDADFATVLSRYFDLDAFATHLAVEQYVTNWDSILGETGMSNFYLYRRMTDSRYTLLVWDQDGSLSLPELPLWSGIEGNVLLRRAMGIPAVRLRYLQALRQAAETATRQDWLRQEAEAAYNLIRAAAREDPYRVCTVESDIIPCSAETFETGMEELRAYLQRRPSFVTAGIAGQLDITVEPWLHQGDVMNYANQEGVLTPGSLAEVRLDGEWNVTEWAHTFPLPRRIATVGVTVGGVEAPMVSVTPGAAVFQVPLEVQYGPATVTLTHEGATTNPVTAEIRPSCTGVFAVTHATGILVTASAPAMAGEVVVIYTTGLAPPPTGVQAGWPAPMDSVVSFRQSVAVNVARVPARVIWAGLAPGLAGVQVIIAEVPAGVPAGAPLPELVVVIDGEPGTPYPLAVR